jgi:methyl-accepting chemotaxis protein
MQFVITITHNLDEQTGRRLDRIGDALDQIAKELQTMTQELKDFIAAVDAATDKIAARIQKLVDNSSLSDADKKTLQVEVDKLNALGQDPANPIPPVVSA